MTEAALPYNTEIIRAVCQRNGWDFTDLDDGRGYLVEINAAEGRLLTGGGPIAAYPINPSPATSIAQDKYFTAKTLESQNIRAVKTDIFFISPRFATLRGPGREEADLHAFLARLQADFVLKPNRGARGDFVCIFSELSAVQAYLDAVKRHYDQIIVQPYLPLSEYRVFVLNDRAVFCYEKQPLILQGDDIRTWDELKAAKDQELLGFGVSAIPDPAFHRALDGYGLHPGMVARSADRIPIPGRRNLSTGGRVAGFTTDVPGALARISVRAAQAIGLRLAGVDVLVPDTQAGAEGPIVLEVNGNPSITSLRAAGRDDIAMAIWDEVLRGAFSG